MRIHLRVILLGLLLPLVAAAATADVAPAATPATSAIPGDVDCDGQLTPLDALDFLGSFADTQAPAGCLVTHGDLTCDERQDQEDVIELLYILIGAERGECGGPPNSLGLINQALEGGMINAETAALYSVFVAFDDPRLPLQYHGAGAENMEPPVDLNLISSQLNGFSAGVRAQLDPFFIAPMHQGSWWDARYNGSSAPAGLGPGPILEGEWGSVAAQTAQVRLWYPLDDFTLHQLATSTAQEIDSHIWPQLTGLMGRAPLPDGGSVMQGRGGDDRLDVVISNDMPTFGAVGLAPNWCERTPALIYADPELAAQLGVPFHIAVGHEIMHAIQFTYDLLELPGGNGGCADAGYAWWAEASGTWTEDFLYPSVNTEHTGPRGDRQVKQFISSLDDPLDSGGDLFRGTNLGRPYGAYLWAFYVAHEYGDQMIRQMWENMEGASALDAMDSALPGGFEEVWPDFAVAVVNKAPFDDFRQWDGVEQEPDWNGSTYRDHQEQVVIAGDNSWTGTSEHDKSIQVDWPGSEHLSATANSYVFQGDNVRSVTFHNGYMYTVTDTEFDAGTLKIEEVRPAEETRGLKLQVLIKIAGQEWQLEDWTNYISRTFCLDRADERLEEIIFISTNSVPEKDYKIEAPPYPGGPQMWVSDLGCWRYEGTLTNRYYGSDNFEELITVKDAVVEAPPSFPGATLFNIQFTPIQGTIDWSYNWTPGDCVYSGSETGLALNDDYPSLYTYPGVVAGLLYRSADANFATERESVTITINCPGDPTESYEDVIGASFPHSVDPYHAADGSLLEGSMNVPPEGGSAGYEITWHFEAKRE